MPVKERLAQLRTRVSDLLIDRRSGKLSDVHVTEIISSSRERLSTTDVRDIDRRIRDADLMRPPGTG